MAQGSGGWTDWRKRFRTPLTSSVAGPDAEADRIARKAVAELKEAVRSTRREGGRKSHETKARGADRRYVPGKIAK
jgi:hypothetical protein